MTSEGSQCKDIMFLEELMVVESASVVVKKEEGEEDDDACSDAETPPSPTQEQGPVAKRRRRGAPLAVAARGSPAKAAAAGAVDGCLGCGRLRCAKCFRDPAATIIWGYPDGRGGWCQDCHSLWRTSFSQTHTLSLFASWLLNAENLATYHWFLMAFVSFGCDVQIRREALAERVDLMRRLWAMLGAPPQGFTVSLLDAGDSRGDSDLEPRALVQVLTAAGWRWGLVTPELPQLAAIRSQPFARPFLDQWTPLRPTTPEDDAWVAQHWGVVLPPHSDASSSIAVLAAGPALPASKSHAKFELWVAATKKTFHAFAESNWQTALKESALRPFINAAGQFCAAAGTEGCADIHAQGQQWMSGLGAVKKMLNLLRSHKSTKARLMCWSQLADLAEPMKVTGEFLQTLGIEPFFSFQLLALRALLVKLVDVEKAFAGPLKVICRQLAAAFATQPAEKNAVKKEQKALPSTGVAVDSSLWLRSVLGEVLGAIVPKTSKADEMPQQAKVLLLDLRDARDSVKEAFGEAAPAEFLQDLAAVIELLAEPAGNPKPSPTRLKAALGLIQSDNMAAVRLALESAVWTFCLTTAACAVQASSKDSLGDAKMERALAILRDPRLPLFVRPAEGSDLIAAASQVPFVVNGARLEALDESLLCVIEAQSLWSDIRAESAADLVTDWAKGLVAAVASLNEVQWLCLAGCFAKSGLFVSTAAVALAEPVGPAAAVSFEALAKATDEVLVDENGLLWFCERVRKCFGSFPQIVQDAMEIAALLDQLSGSLSDSIGLRGGVMEVVAALASVKLPAAAPETLIAEWQLKNEQEGTPQNAQLALILEVLRAVERLRVMKGSPGESPEADVVVKLSCEGDGSDHDLSASLQIAMTLNELVLDWDCLGSLRLSAQDSLHSILQLLTASVDLAAVNFETIDAVGDAGSLDLGGSLATLFKPAKAASLTKAAAKTLGLGPKRGDVKGWPFEAPPLLLVDSRLRSLPS